MALVNKTRKVVKGRGIEVFDRVVRSAAERSGVGSFYERILSNKIEKGPIPAHIGIILDGNRRWAEERGLRPWKGHEEGAKTLEDFLDWCTGIPGIGTITAYVFSTENFARSEEEVRAIMELVEKHFTRLLTDEKIRRHRIRIKAIGKINLLPPNLQELISNVEESTKDHEGIVFNIAIAYGGRTEILDAIRELVTDIHRERLSLDDLTEKEIEKRLYTRHLTNPSADMIIRTSGEIRVSNFLIWQGAYSELCFVDVLWPAFRKIDFLRALRLYQERKRRYGS